MGFEFGDLKAGQYIITVTKKKSYKSTKRLYSLRKEKKEIEIDVKKRKK